jgi:hypothetical protein
VPLAAAPAPDAAVTRDPAPEAAATAGGGSGALKRRYAP